MGSGIAHVCALGPASKSTLNDLSEEASGGNRNPNGNMARRWSGTDNQRDPRRQGGAPPWSADRGPPTSLSVGDCDLIKKRRSRRRTFKRKSAGRWPPVLKDKRHRATNTSAISITRLQPRPTAGKVHGIHFMKPGRYGTAVEVDRGINNRTTATYETTKAFVTKTWQELCVAEDFRPSRQQILCDVTRRSHAL